MKTVYIDHNIFIYLFDSVFPEEKRAFTKLLSYGSIELALSWWHLYEICKQDSYTRAVCMAKYIDLLNPRWLIDRRKIQELEIESFIASFCFGKSKLFKAFKRTLSEVITEYIPTPNTANYTAESIVRNLFKTGSFAEIEKTGAATPEILTTLQTARKDGLYTKDLQEKVDFEYLYGLLPPQINNGKISCSVEKKELCNVLLRNKRHLYKSSPCLLVEGLLAFYRSKQANRKNEPPDAVDLQHAAGALAYCDYFVSNDGFLFGGASYVKKKGNLPVGLYRNLNDLVAHFEL